MSVTTLVGAGILGGRGSASSGPVDNWTVAWFLLTFVIVPVIAIVALVWLTLTAPPQDNSWCAKWVGGHCAEKVRQEGVT